MWYASVDSGFWSFYLIFTTRKSLADIAGKKFEQGRGHLQEMKVAFLQGDKVGTEAGVVGISGNGRVRLDSDGSVIISLVADVKRVREEVST